MVSCGIADCRLPSAEWKTKTQPVVEVPSAEWKTKTQADLVFNRQSTIVNRKF
jgi:hypothetical protein